MKMRNEIVIFNFNTEKQQLIKLFTMQKNMTMYDCELNVQLQYVMSSVKKPFPAIV